MYKADKKDNREEVVKINYRKKFLKASELAALFSVSTKTVRRWTKEGKLSSLVTLGGHHRDSKREIRKILERALRGRNKKDEKENFNS